MPTGSDIYGYIQMFWDELKPVYGSQKNALYHHNSLIDTEILKWTRGMGGEIK